MKKIESKFPGAKILVAEDYFINQELTQDILEMMECQVDIAENGQVALDKFSNGKYDLILMDIQMPEKDGLEVTKEIRQREEQEKLARTPIVALTASATKEDSDRCLNAGMDDYMSKPLETHKLEAILNKYINR